MRAEEMGDSVSGTYRGASLRIIDGINRFMKMPDSPVWYQAIDEWGGPQYPKPIDWIQYAPVMLNIPVTRDLIQAGSWIHNVFQQPDGNGVKGGFIDWMEISPRYRAAAEYWQRFIDTSFYAIAVLTGGYSF